jgi:hypothetical protein
MCVELGGGCKCTRINKGAGGLRAAAVTLVPLSHCTPLSLCSGTCQYNPHAKSILLMVSGAAAAAAKVRRRRSLFALGCRIFSRLKTATTLLPFANSKCSPTSRERAKRVFCQVSSLRRPMETESKLSLQLLGPELLHLCCGKLEFGSESTLRGAVFLSGCGKLQG